MESAIAAELPSNYQDNPQGNNYNFNQPPLRELISSQSKLMDQLSRKVATNDKILKNINNRMDSFAFAIKNQHSFNKNNRITNSSAGSCCSSV
jgi:hypothetical protein